MDASASIRPRVVDPYLYIPQAALANLSQSMNAREEEILLAYGLEGSYLKEGIINVALLSTFLVCAAVAVYVLFSKGIKRKATAGMLMAVMTMWISTVAYWVATLLSAAKCYTVLRDLTSQILDRTIQMQGCLDSLPVSTSAVVSCSQEIPLTDLPASKAYGNTGCIGTVALTVNIVIGDSIVWWRAWVLWPDNQCVRCICVLMILLTLITGAIDTAGPCVDGAVSTSDLGSLIGLQPGALFSGNLWGLIAGLSSLLTNLVATTLIVYRAWEHRRIILSYLKGSSPRTQVERTLALLVESGLLYCALWVVIVVYQFSFLSLEVEASRFAGGFQYVMGGCLVPLIGIYPTLIIILCAVDKSLHEKAANDPARHTSIVFEGDPPNRRRGTLSELLSATSVYATPEEHAGSLSEVPQDELRVSSARSRRVSV